MAMIFLNASESIDNSNSALRLTAMNLIDEQFAEIESRVAKGNLSTGNLSFLGKNENLISYNVNENNPVTFTVSTIVKSHVTYDLLFIVTVKVEWFFAGKNFEIESEKIFRAKNI